LRDFDEGEAMNRAFYIILIPVVLVAIGYVLVFEFIVGTPPAYWRLILPFAFVGGALWWFGRGAARKKGAGAQ
jgi:hypothetical protein